MIDFEVYCANSGGLGLQRVAEFWGKTSRSHIFSCSEVLPIKEALVGMFTAAITATHSFQH